MRASAGLQASRGDPFLLDEAETARCVGACRAHFVEAAPPAVAEQLARAWIDVVGEALQRQSALGGGGGGRKTQSPSRQEDKPDGRHKCELSGRGAPRGQKSVAYNSQRKCENFLSQGTSLTR